MIRIVKGENSEVIGEQSKAALSLIGVAIAKYPKPYKKLLDRFGLSVPKDDEVSLVNGIIEGLALQNKSFNLELSLLLKRMVEKEAAYNPDTEELHFVEAISGAITGVSNTVGSIVEGKNRQRMAKDQARKEMINNMLVMKSRQQQAVVDERKWENKQSLYLSLAVLGLLGIFGFFYMRQRTGQVIVNPS